jgi:hypothetical protein
MRNTVRLICAALLGMWAATPALSQELRFLDAKQGGAFLATPDEYTRRMSDFDLRVMIRTTQKKTIQDYLALARSAAQSWTADEQQRVAAAFEFIRPELSANSVPLPKEVLMIKTSGAEEWEAAYTRGAAIILPAGDLAQNEQGLRRLVAHELFHVLARTFPEMTNRIYPAIGFHPCGALALPPDIAGRILNNPDTPRNDHCIEVTSSAGPVTGMPTLLSPDGKFDPDLKGGIGAVLSRMQTGLMVVTPAPGGVARPVLVNGMPRIIPWRELPDLSAKIGRNTGYLIHAEEMLADNFALLVTSAGNVPSPEVLERIRVALRTAGAPPIADAKLRDTRAPAGDPDISGVWQVRGSGLRIVTTQGGDPPWKPWAEKVFRDRAEDEKRGVTRWDPTGACYGSGVPRIFTAGYFTEIIQTEDAIVWIYESQHVWRIIHMNQRMPAKLEHNIRGYSVGHWEGDTLVVETAGLSRKGQIDERGTMMTDSTRVIERIRRVGNQLENTFTVIDPTAYERPWQSRRVFNFMGGHQLSEYVCEENNRNVPGADGKFITIIK